MLSHQIIQTLTLEQLEDVLVVENLLIIVLCTGQIAVDSVIARLGNHKLVFFEGLQERNKICNIHYTLSSLDKTTTAIL